MNVKWVKIRSWHAVEGRVLGVWKTHCGRYAVGTPVEELPGGKSCESCLKITTWLAEQGYGR